MLKPKEEKDREMTNREVYITHIGNVRGKIQET